MKEPIGRLGSCRPARLRLIALEMEAMAAGLPVLATAIAGIPELVEDGVSGRLVAPGDTSGFAAAMADLLADPARARAMGRAGRQKVAAEFSIAGEAAKLDGLFGN